MNFAASAWEFRNRFWIIGAIYWCSFSAYWVDHQNAAASVAQLVVGLAHRPATNADVRLTFFAGVLLAALATLLRTWATALIRPEVMVDGNLHTHTVLADGPYRFTRNPLYLGSILLAIGYAVMASRVGAVILIALSFIFFYRLIFREERELLLARGQLYADYCKAVPRMWPALRPRVPSTGLKPQWGAGLLGETFIWGLVVGLLIFALTFDIRIYFLVLGLTYGVYFL